ncbi:MAG TPA: ABC transporter permease, partial [Gemmatimonadales bacterium]|nr:ABC transporter permease [Gemmatimonadales bacterium]
MLLTLAFRHLWVRKLRALFLLAGFAIGVGVMVVLLSVGEAMVEQSRDVSLVGGGEITVLPQGIDVEAMRTGGLGGMFFGIDRARFLTRQAIGGPRFAGVIRTVAPAIEGKLLYLCRAGESCDPAPVRAGGEIPNRAAAVGAGLDIRNGVWHDSPADSAYVSPTRQQLYDELDRFHIPPAPDSTWGEWHYFNVTTGPDEWWYVTYLVGGELSLGPSDGVRWGGRVLMTHRRPD